MPKIRKLYKPRGLRFLKKWIKPVKKEEDTLRVNSRALEISVKMKYETITRAVMKRNQTVSAVCLTLKRHVRCIMPTLNHPEAYFCKGGGKP